MSDPIRSASFSLGLIVICSSGWHCGAGPSLHVGNGQASTTVSGFVFKGPISEGTVTAYQIDTHAMRGDTLASTTTDSAGAFILSLPAYSGPLLLVAGSGSYTEEAVGASAKLDGSELQAIISNYAPGPPTDGVLISPVSHLAAVLAAFWTQHQGQTLQAAAEEASARLNTLFGQLDWRTGKPTDFNAAGSGVQVSSNADRAGLLLGALSEQALGIATRANVTPGSGFSTVDFINALTADLQADGFFDGIGPAGPIVLPLGTQLTISGPSGTKLDGQTMRGAYAFALAQYLQNPLNHGGLTFADAKTLTTSLSSNSDSHIFRDNSQFNNQPPILSLSSPPTRYTNQQLTSFEIQAVDSSSGVAAVYAQNGALPPVQGALVNGDAASGVYRFTIELSAGLNTIVIWGIDRAGNNGHNLTAPAQISASVTLDNSRPTPTLTPVPSYFSEQHLRLTLNGAGMPTVPPAFEVPATEQKQTLLTQGTVWKIGTRLSWGPATPSGASLENGDLNGSNTPFFQFGFTYLPDTEAPIAQVRYSIAASCNGCPNFAAATGDLLPAARTGPQQLYFDLPLAAETIPALTQLRTSPLTLAVSVIATDAAGNTGTLEPPIIVYFHVLGSPLMVAQEPNYPGMNDPRSIFPYRVAAGTYHQSWAPNSVVTSDNGGQANLIRVMRYLIRNPFSVAIPVASFSGSATSWAVNEEWDEEVNQHFSTSFIFEGHTYYSEDAWQFSPATTSYVPCSGALQSQYYYIYPGYPYPAPYPCQSNPPPAAGTRPSAAYASSSAISLRAYKNPQPAGGEQDLADSAVDDGGATYFQVPPATGTTPGVLVVYVVRPYIPSRMSGATGPLIWQTLDMTVAPAYRNYIQDFWSLDHIGDCDVGITAQCYFSFAYRDARKLVAANEVLSGHLDFASGTMRSDGRVLNDLNAFASTGLPYTVSR